MNGEYPSNGCNQWLSLAKIVLRLPSTSRNRSLVARTNMCGECINVTYHYVELRNARNFHH